MSQFCSPVYNIKRVPVEKIQANSYNPNHVAPPEMKLLYKSILEDGYTMPIVCYYLEDIDKFEIVDGFHRYTVIKKHKDIFERVITILYSKADVVIALSRKSRDQLESW